MTETTEQKIQRLLSVILEAEDDFGLYHTADVDMPDDADGEVVMTVDGEKRTIRHLSQSDTNDNIFGYLVDEIDEADLIIATAGYLPASEVGRRHRLLCDILDAILGQDWPDSYVQTYGWYI